MRDFKLFWDEKCTHMSPWFSSVKSIKIWQTSLIFCGKWITWGSKWKQNGQSRPRTGGWKATWVAQLHDTPTASLSLWGCLQVRGGKKKCFVRAHPCWAGPALWNSVIQSICHHVLPARGNWLSPTQEQPHSNHWGRGLRSQQWHLPPEGENVIPVIIRASFMDVQPIQLHRASLLEGPILGLRLCYFGLQIPYNFKARPSAFSFFTGSWKLCS